MQGDRTRTSVRSIIVDQSGSEVPINSPSARLIEVVRIDNGWLQLGNAGNYVSFPPNVLGWLSTAVREAASAPPR